MSWQSIWYESWHFSCKPSDKLIVPKQKDIQRLFRAELTLVATSWRDHSSGELCTFLVRVNCSAALIIPRNGNRAYRYDNQQQQTGQTFDSCIRLFCMFLASCPFQLGFEGSAVTLLLLPLMRTSSAGVSMLIESLASINRRRSNPVALVLQSPNIGDHLLLSPTRLIAD